MPILKHGPLAAVLTRTTALLLMNGRRQLRRFPPKWRTLLTKRTAPPLHTFRPRRVLPIIVLTLPPFVIAVPTRANLVSAAPVTIPVRAAPLALGGLQKTMEASPLVPTVSHNKAPPLTTRRRFIILLRAAGCSSDVRGDLRLRAPDPVHLNKLTAPLLQNTTTK